MALEQSVPLLMNIAVALQAHYPVALLRTKLAVEQVVQAPLLLQLVQFCGHG